MTKPMTNPEQGEYAILVNGKWVTLVANFRNMRVFEKTNGSLFKAIERVSAGAPQISDFVDMICCFSTTTLDEEAVYTAVMADKDKILESVVGFFPVLFPSNPEQAAEASTEETDKKKT